VSLADQIIDHGPYAAGDLSPVAYGVDYAALNELRAELIAGRQARGLDGATPTIHTTRAEFNTKEFWVERINPVAAAHGIPEPMTLANGWPDDTDVHMLKHPDGRMLLIIRTDREGA
jgi:hypothetical protein